MVLEQLGCYRIHAHLGKGKSSSPGIGTRIAEKITAPEYKIRKMFRPHVHVIIINYINDISEDIMLPFVQVFG